MLFSVVIIDLIGFGIMIPVLPFYAREFGASATTVTIERHGDEWVSDALRTPRRSGGVEHVRARNAIRQSVR